MNKLFKALNDTTRRRILDMLKTSDLTAGEIADAFQISKPSISHHLDLLKQALCQVAEALGKQHHLIPKQIQAQVEDLSALLEKQGSDVLYHLAEWLNGLGLKLTVTVAAPSQNLTKESNRSAELVVR